MVSHAKLPTHLHSMKSWASSLFAHMPTPASLHCSGDIRQGSLGPQWAGRTHDGLLQQPGVLPACMGALAALVSTFPPGALQACFRAVVLLLVVAFFSPCLLGLPPCLGMCLRQPRKPSNEPLLKRTTTLPCNVPFPLVSVDYQPHQLHAGSQEDATGAAHGAAGGREGPQDKKSKGGCRGHTRMRLRLLMPEGVHPASPWAVSLSAQVIGCPTGLRPVIRTMTISREPSHCGFRAAAFAHRLPLGQLGQAPAGLQRGPQTAPTTSRGWASTPGGPLTGRRTCSSSPRLWTPPSCCSSRARSAASSAARGARATSCRQGS